MNSTTSVPVADIVAALKVRYPAAVCALDWGGQHDSDPETRRRNGWRLLVMARLSAQCTDARVNQVCRELFRLYPTPGALAAAPQADVEAVIRPCGLFRTKAESIRATCAILAADWAGLVPEDMDTLLSLPGVGRKIANLVRGDLYGQPGIVADTPCIRICGRLGFYPEELKDPVRAERILSPLIPPEEQSDFCHRIVQFGRDTCTARAPACGGGSLGAILCARAKASLMGTRNRRTNRRFLKAHLNLFVYAFILVVVPEVGAPPGLPGRKAPHLVLVQRHTTGIGLPILVVIVEFTVLTPRGRLLRHSLPFLALLFHHHRPPFSYFPGHRP